MKPDEAKLLKGIQDGKPPKVVAADLGMHEKRLQYILLKWTDKGWWDYGVSARTGWLTDKGIAQVAFTQGGCF